MIALVYGWQAQNSQVGSLQAILAEEIVMLSTSEPAMGSPDHAAYALARRQALMTLAALPLAFSTSDVLSADGRRLMVARESFLAQCAASITACWQLLSGSDLATVDDIVSSCLLPLEAIARENSGHQRAAASLASQAHRIRCTIALHYDPLVVRERHCKQALYYAGLASDADIQVSALTSLGVTYRYGGDPARAAAVYERALALEAEMSPLQRSQVNAKLAVAYAQLGRDEDAIRAVGLAEEGYPDDPQDDPSYLHAEFTPASLARDEGLAYLALAESHAGRGYPQKAAEVLAMIDRPGSPAAPDRIRTEIANHRARAAVLLDDLDAFEIHIHRGIDGAEILGSKQREREAHAAWKQASLRWPAERRVKAIGERIGFPAGE